MMMTHEEIRTSYRDARDPKKQISILAQLNEVTEEHIVDIIKEKEAKMARPRKAAAVNEDFKAAVDEMTGKRIAMPDIVKETVEIGINAMDEEIASLEGELTAIEDKIKILREKRDSVTKYMEKSI